MRAPDSFARTLRLEGSARVSPQGSTPGRGALTFSRRDLLRTGAAGLVGLGLPFAAPLRAFAGQCFPGPDPNILYSGGAEARPDNWFVQNGFWINPPQLVNGQICVTGYNYTGLTLVLVGYFYNAPNALPSFQCTDLNNPNAPYLQNQALMGIWSQVIPPAQTGSPANPVTFTFCMPVPVLCQDPNASPGFFQHDFVVFSSSGLFPTGQPAGVPVGVPVPLNGQNILGGFLMTGNTCQNPNPACIRMTGGGGTILTAGGGLTIETKQGFQLRCVGHSNLELHWTMPDGTSHVFKVGPQDSTNFIGAFTPCPNGGGGGQPLNNPNTILGTATGTLDGLPGTLFLNFVDCGEPGTSDTRQIIIYQGIDPVNGLPITQLVAGGTINNGNNQAHAC